MVHDFAGILNFMMPCLSQWPLPYLDTYCLGSLLWLNLQKLKRILFNQILLLVEQVLLGHMLPQKGNCMLEICTSTWQNYSLNRYQNLFYVLSGWCLRTVFLCVCFVEWNKCTLFVVFSLHIIHMLKLFLFGGCSDFWSFWSSWACAATYRSRNRTLQRFWLCSSRYLMSSTCVLYLNFWWNCFLTVLKICNPLLFVCSLLNLNMLRRHRVWMENWRLLVEQSRYSMGLMRMLFDMIYNLLSALVCFPGFWTHLVVLLPFFKCRFHLLLNMLGYKIQQPKLQILMMMKGVDWYGCFIISVFQSKFVYFHHFGLNENAT